MKILTPIVHSTKLQFIARFAGAALLLLAADCGVAQVTTNITLTVPSPVVIGSARHFSVLANLNDGTTSNITSAASVTSSNTAIVNIIAAGRLGAVTNGTVGLKAIYQTFTNIQLVTATNLSMTYRFSFNDPVGSLTVTDSVAGAVAYVTNAPSSGTDGAGNFVFDGAGGYLDFPPDVLTNYGALTVEFWAALTAAGTWARFFDFGSGPSTNMFITPVAGGPILRTAFTVNGAGAETRCDASFTPDLGVLHHYVFTLAGAQPGNANGLAKLYFDGAQVGVNNNFLLTPEDVGSTTNNWLGRSQYAADPYLSGQMAEFRIYNGALDPNTIAFDTGSGPDIITNNPGALTSMTVTAGSPIPEFASEQVTVSGTFANLPNPVNITTLPQTTYSVSNPNIFVVNSAGVLSAAAPGTGTLQVVSYSLTQSVQVVVVAIPPGMTHRWPFNTDFNDAIDATTPAIPHNTVGLDGLGNAVLDGSGAANGTTGSYIELPANILLGYRSVALEAWYTDQCGDGTGVNRNWARIWDFGSAPGNNLFLTPFVGGEVDTMRCSLNINNAGEWTLNCVRPLPLTNLEHHVVYTLDASNHIALLYVDGALVAQNRDYQVVPSNMGVMPNNWLGRSQYGDPLFEGLIDEFRIYNGTIDAVQVGIDFATGPNTIVTNPGAVTAVSLVLTTNMPAGNRQSAQVLASFASLANVPVTSAAGGWTSSDPTVARVDSYGRITATGPGSATISATFRSVTGTATVIVSAATPPVLTHRYNFNNGDITDSVGGSNGLTVGTVTFANGMVNIDTNGWVSLPGHLFDTNLEVTLETWCVVSNLSASGTRMADFGTSPNSGGSVRTAFAIAPSVNGSAYIALRQSPNDAVGTPSINSYGRAAFNTTNHYAFAISDINRRVDFYFNGELKDSFPFNTQPDQFMGGNAQFAKMLGYQTTNMTEGWFGLNVGGTAPSGWWGSIDEFRIWAGAMNKIQAKMSYLSGPNNPQIDPGGVQALTVSMSDSTMVLGALQHPTVSATFSNAAGTFDLTGVPAVLVTSDNSAAVGVVNGGDSKLQAVGTGNAHIVVSYGGLKVTNTVTVIAKPAALLTHRYSFRGNANDAIGHANGKLFGNAAIAWTSSGSNLALDGSANPPSYLRLPSDLISGYDLATFEVFYAASAGSSGTQQRLWDFGDHVLANASITGVGYLYEAAGRGAVGMPNATPGAAETAAIAPSANRSQFTTNTTHVAVTVDSVNHILSIYTNGVYSVSATNPVVDLGLVTDNFSFLGRSQWADPLYNGTIDEFRLYYGLLTPAQISASYAFGPDPDTLTATHGPGAEQVTISWPASLVTAGFTLQVSLTLNPTSWGAAGGGSVVNGYNQVTVNAGATPSIYRLIK